MKNGVWGKVLGTIDYFEGLELAVAAGTCAERLLATMPAKPMPPLPEILSASAPTTMEP